jgi:hypothetical protein
MRITKNGSETLCRVTVSNGSTTATVRLRRKRRLLAPTLTEYLSERASFSMRSRVSAFTRLLCFSARDTVEIDTPASCAMSCICSLPVRRGGNAGGDAGGALRLRGLRFIRFVELAIAAT